MSQPARFPFVRHPRDYPVRIKLLAVYLLFVLLLLFLLMVYNHTSRQAFINKSNQTLYAAASTVAANLDAFTTNNLNIMEMASSFPEMEALLRVPAAARAGSSEEQIVISTLDVLTRYPWDQFNTVSVGLLDATGTNVADTVFNRIGSSEADTDYFRQTMRQGRPYASPVLFEADGGGVNIYFAAPVRVDMRGPVIGVVRGQFGIATLQNEVFNYRGLAGEQSFAVLIDEYHFHIAGNPNSQSLFHTSQVLSDSDLTRLATQGRLPNRSSDELMFSATSLEAGLLNSSQEPFFEAVLYENGPDYQFAIVPLISHPWVVAYVQSSEVFLGAVDRQMLQAPLIGFVLLFLAAGAAFFVAGWITGPIHQLIDASAKIAAGDLSVRAEVNSQDEIGQLGRALNQMTDHLQQTLDLLEQQMIQIFRQQEQSDAVLDNIDDPVLLVDSEGKITYVNQAFLTVLGYRAHDIANRPLTSLHPGFAALVSRLKQGERTESRSIDGELVWHSNTGIPMEFGVSIVRLSGLEDQGSGLVVSMQDIGRYKQLDRMKTSFMQHISHELRTPLTSIRLYTRLLRVQRDSSKHLQYLDALDFQTGRLIRISEKVLDATRFADRSAMGSWETISLNNLLKDLETRFAHAAQEAQIEFEVEMLERDLFVHGESTWLLRAFSELVENAVLYTPQQGQVRVFAHQLLTDDQVQQVVVEIEDNGPGIKPEHLASILSDDFARGEMAETGNKPGIGLGVAIARMITQHHEGWLLAESRGEPGMGSRFMIVLPLLHQQVSANEAVASSQRRDGNQETRSDSV